MDGDQRHRFSSSSRDSGWRVICNTCLIQIDQNRDGPGDAVPSHHPVSRHEAVESQATIICAGQIAVGRIKGLPGSVRGGIQPRDFQSF